MEVIGILAAKSNGTSDPTWLLLNPEYAFLVVPRATVPTHWKVLLEEIEKDPDVTALGYVIDAQPDTMA